MVFSIIRLNDVLAEMGEDSCLGLIANFTCDQDPDVEFFLHAKAIEFEKLGLARTYLVFTTYQLSQIIVGYFAIAQKYLKLHTKISKTKVKKISGDKKVRETTVFLLGQMAKNSAHKNKKLISGAELLQCAYKEIIKAYELVGGRYILVECKNAFF